MSSAFLRLFNEHSEINKNELFSFYNQNNNVKHMCVIGKAGIGKSTYIQNNYSNKEYILTAYTGIAALQINGQTLSSFFKLGKNNDVEPHVSIKTMSKYNKKQLKNSIGMVIDEYYTVPLDIATSVDIICKKVRKNQQSFGGLKIILVGDDRQTKSIREPFADSELYNSLIYERVDLPEHAKMRLTKDYMKFCDQFRNPALNKKKIIRLLNDKRFSTKRVVGRTVYYTNKSVENHNIRSMNKFKGDIIYEDSRGVSYKKNCPIYIKYGPNELCNGMLGHLIANDDGVLTLKIKLNKVKKYKVQSSVLDMVPAFAMTIHKAQCKTFKGINIFLSKKSIFNERGKLIRLLYTSLTRVSDFSKCYIYLYE